MKILWLMLGLALGFGLFEVSIHNWIPSFTGNGLYDPWIWMLLLVLGIGLTFTPYLNSGRELLLGALIGFVVSTYFLNPGFFEDFISGRSQSPFGILSGGIME